MTPSDVKTIADNVSDFIELPDGIARLRKAVLTLAVSGKLVPQDLSEGSAEELCAEIQKERAATGEGSRKRTQKPLPPITDEEVPFEIPKSWKWVRLMEIGKLDTGKTPRTGVTGNYAGDIPFVGPGDVQHGKINSYSKLVTRQGASESKYLYPGDVLMVCIGGTIGKTALVTGTYTFNQQINKITPCLVDSTFLFGVFESGYFQGLVWSKASGGATPLVNLTRWSSCVVPLPPLAEQKRIVAKVEEVMKELDILEAKKKERDAVRTLLTKSAAHDLGTEGKTLFLEHLTELVRTPADVKELEGALLTLAVSGRLVRQDSLEGTAVDLYEEITTECLKAKKTKIGTRKKDALEEISDAQIPYEMPKSWKMARLGDVTVQITDGTHFTPKYIHKGIPFLSIKDISGGSLSFAHTKYISEQEHTDLSKRCNPQKDDILICRIGTLGKAILVDTDRPFSIFVSLGLIKYPTKFILPQYLALVFNSPWLYGQYNEIKAGGSHTNKLNLKEIPKLIIPIPPLAEQKRIVAKVEEVMGLIKHLRQVLV